MRSVRIAQHLCGLPHDRPGEDPVTDRRQARVGTEEVGAPSDRRPDPPCLVSPHQRFPDLGPDAAIRARGAGWQLLGQWAHDRPVGVEVVPEDEFRLGRGRSLDDRFHERRVELRPLRIRRVGTVVHDGRSIARALDFGVLRDVCGEDLDVSRQVGQTTSAHGSHPFSSPGQVPGHSEPQRTRPEDDVEVPAFVHAFLPRYTRLRFGYLCQGREGIHLRHRR